MFEKLAAAGIGQILSYASTGLTLLGGLQQASAQRQAAANTEAVAAANARILQQQAGQEEAVAQVEAQKARRKAELMASRALAVAAASGAGTEGVANIIGGILEEGEREAGYAKYGGAERAEGLRYRGEVGKYEAAARAEQYRKSASATLLGSFGSAGMGLYDRLKPSATLLGSFGSAGMGLYDRLKPSAPPTVSERRVEDYDYRGW